MKRYILALTLLLVGSSIFAYCVAGATFANAAVPCFDNMSATPANITPWLWLQGSADFATNGSAAVAPGTCTAGGTTGGCDSDGMDYMDETCAFDNTSILGDGVTCLGSAAGSYYLLTDMGSAAFDGCTGPAGTIRACLLAYDDTGRYALQSRTQGLGWSAWDSVGTSSASFLMPDFASSIAQGSTATQLNVNWSIPAAVTYGAYEAGDAPASPIATQFRVYFYQGAAAPVNFATAAWTAGSTYAIATANTVDMAIPAWVSGQYTYMSYSLIFEGRELPFVSRGYRTLHNPSGAPVIASASAVNQGLSTRVTFTSADESRVTGYDVVWAPAGSSDFAAVGSRISPMGNNHTYNADVRIPAAGSYVVKVAANLVDGTVEYSAPANVASGIVIKNKTRVTPN